MYVIMPIIREIVYNTASTGVDLALLCEKIGLSKQELDNAEQLVDFIQAQNVWNQAVALSGNLYLGLHLGKQKMPANIGVLGSLIQTCPDLITAFIKVCELNASIGDMFVYNYQVIDNQLITIFTPALEWQNLYPESARQAIDNSASSLVHLFRILSAQIIKPTRAEFAHKGQLLDKQVYEDVLKCPVFLDQPQNRLFFRLEDVYKPVIAYNKQLSALFEELVKQEILKMKQLQNTTQKVKNLLLSKYQHFIPQISDIAGELNLSERTLQRELKSEGTSFWEISEEWRKILAISLMKNRKITVNEIAYTLGYQEPNVFRRAFKRWTGKSPKDFIKN
jgi:AraC-like DNA-binding protein